MTAPHTPGPWFSDGFKIFVPDEDVARSLDYPVAWVQGTARDEPEMVANARLIAAAPEMLEALVALMPTNASLSNPNIRDRMTLPMDVEVGALRRAAAAIAKAKGGAA